MQSASTPFWRSLAVVCSIGLSLTGCQQATPPEQTAPPQGESESAVKQESSNEEDAVQTELTTKTPPAQSERMSSEVVAEAAKPLEYINPLTTEQIHAGTILLFDNETLFGWQSTGEVNWSVDDQAITASSGPIGLLLTEVRFADFELSLEFQVSPDGNGGVFIRCTDSPGDPQADCYEINIADTHPDGYTTGSLVGLAPATEKLLMTDDQWHKMTIVAQGNMIAVTVDGQSTLKFTDDRNAALTNGLIGLQKNSGQVAYRNIQLTPLSLTDLFNGTDLAGWQEVPDSKSVIDVVDGAIHVVNGPGFLETEQTFGDFLVQFDAKTNAAELNSGLFFRAEKGTAEAPSNGYEVQIHNGIENDDPNQPANAGTGAIFRRVDARRVTAQDGEWATITLVADGPRIATWVQGYPVVNWLDEREPNENPRRGLRTEAGHLSLQGHDPTTDLLFREIKISQMDD